MTQQPPRHVRLTRIDNQHYAAENDKGARIEFGRGEGLMSPVELLLAGLAGCSAIDVDGVTSRRATPDTFQVDATADKLDEDGASRLDNVALDFQLRFPDTEEGRQAASMVERIVKLSHDKTCTVSRTIEAATPVRFSINE